MSRVWQYGRLGALVAGVLAWQGTAGKAMDLYVDPARGSDGNTGTRAAPLQTVSAAIREVPERVAAPITIHLAPGVYKTTGGKGMPSNVLILDRTMRREGNTTNDVRVRIVGHSAGFQGAAKPGDVVLDWGGVTLVHVTRGVWSLEDLQVGTRSYKGSQQGIAVSGWNSLVHLRDVRIRTGSQCWFGLEATRGGEARLHGRIELNEDLHDKAPENSYGGIGASYGGSVRWNDEAGVLSLGNGSLNAGYFGVIELGCRTARITSWIGGGHCFSINNSGRIDLHGTETTLCARHKDNAVIGLEDDGHIQAKDARIILETQAGVPSHVALQKTSTLRGGTFVVRGDGGVLFTAMSGSILTGAVTGKVTNVGADTGAHVALQCSQRPLSLNEVRHGVIDIQGAPAVAPTESGSSPLPVTRVAEAIALARAWLKTQPRANQYLIDTASATQTTNEWFVSFRHVKWRTEKPGMGLVVVEKATGKARWGAQR